MQLRKATMDDAEDLFRWRNDEATRLASFNTEPISWDTHVGWLAKVLANPERELYVAVDDDGNLVGTIRADREEGGYELSWTVAPEYRGRGLGTEMLKVLVGQLSGRLRAQIKTGNAASLAMVKALGFTCVKEDAEVTEWAMIK